MSDAANEKLYTIIQNIVPLELRTVKRDDIGVPHDWFRIPSWRVEFHGGGLQGLDIRIHKSFNEVNGWALTEATTGFLVYTGSAEHNSGEMLEAFGSSQLPKMTREKVEKALAAARERLAALPRIGDEVHCGRAAELLRAEVKRLEYPRAMIPQERDGIERRQSAYALAIRFLDPREAQS